jgi:hypothetical protein
MLGPEEACARNLSAAIREVLNAQFAAKVASDIEGSKMTPSIFQKINEARLLLEVVAEELKKAQK